MNVPPELNVWQKLKASIAKCAWKIYLWASDQTESEIYAELLEEAAREYKSAKANDWRM